MRSEPQTMLHFSSCAVLLLAVLSTSIGCGKSPAVPSPVPASVSIVGLSATVGPLTTTPLPGLLYRLTYQVREGGARTGATLATQRFTFSNGVVAEGTFSSSRVEPGATITLVSTYSVFPATDPAGRVEFSIGFVDDRGNSGTASAAADITPMGF
jgi:hypothetical protein